MHIHTFLDAYLVQRVTTNPAECDYCSTLAREQARAAAAEAELPAGTRRAKIAVYHNIDRDSFFGHRAGHALVKVFEYIAIMPDGIDYGPGQPGVMHVLERAFELFNVGVNELAQEYRARLLRSLSVGDVITLDEFTVYTCESIGWEFAGTPEHLHFVTGADAERLIRARLEMKPGERLTVTVPWDDTRCNHRCIEGRDCGGCGCQGCGYSADPPDSSAGPGSDTRDRDQQ
jgi:hypothetical protein